MTHTGPGHNAEAELLHINNVLACLDCQCGMTFWHRPDTTAPNEDVLQM